MKISAAGLNLVKAFESCMRAVPGRPGYYKTYLDPVGVPTIGWGHTNHHPPRITMNTVWSRQQCDEALVRDISIFEAAVNRLVKVPLKQHQFDALVSFAYNLGEGNLGKSNLLRKLNRGDYQGAAKEFHNWNRAGGRVLPGLVRRRASEALLFQGIPDLNYDGRPDAIRRAPPPVITDNPSVEPEEEVMPQQVDPPEPEPAPKTLWDKFNKFMTYGGGAGFLAWLTDWRVVLALAVVGALGYGIYVFHTKYMSKE